MRRVRAILARFAGMFRRDRHEREWAAEFAAHLELHVDENVRAGMSFEDARREARLKFGGLESAKESMRDRAAFSGIDTIARDVRYALRSLRNSPAFAITAILSLALGLGASLAVFTVADNLLVRPLPYRDASHLVMLWEGGTKGGGDRGEVSPGDFIDWRAQSDVFSGLAGLRELRSPVVDRDRAEEFGKHSVAADFFPLLGVEPIRGRLFSSAEDRPGANPVVLISYRLCQRWFGGDDAVIGRTVQIDSAPRTII